MSAVAIVSILVSIFVSLLCLAFVVLLFLFILGFVLLRRRGTKDVTAKAAVSEGVVSMSSMFRRTSDGDLVEVLVTPKETEDDFEDAEVVSLETMTFGGETLSVVRFAPLLDEHADAIGEYIGRIDAQYEGHADFTPFGVVVHAPEMLDSEEGEGCTFDEIGDYVYANAVHLKYLLLNKRDGTVHVLVQGAALAKFAESVSELSFT